MTLATPTQVDTSNAAAALAQRPKGPIGETFDAIAQMKEAFSLVLPPSISPDRMVRVLQTVVKGNPDLAKPQCRAALLGAAMTVAQLGLDPTPAIGHAYILPFGGKPTFVLGYKGAVFLAAESGVHLKSHVICEHDTYDVEFGTNAHITHRPPPFGQPRGKALAYYCVATFADGTEPMFDVMTVEEIDEIRRNSPGKNSPAWKNHYDEMAKKTVLKRLAKNVPMGTKASLANAHDGMTTLNVSPTSLEEAPDFSDQGGEDDDVADAELVDEKTGEVMQVEDPPGWGEA